MDSSKLQAFSHGFFQDIKALMDTLKKDTLTREEIESYIEENLKKAKILTKRLKIVQKRVKPGRKRK